MRKSAAVSGCGSTGADHRSPLCPLWNDGQFPGGNRFRNFPPRATSDDPSRAPIMRPPTAPVNEKRDGWAHAAGRR
jgi:hypothetical protein